MVERLMTLDWQLLGYGAFVGGVVIVALVAVLTRRMDAPVPAQTPAAATPPVNDSPLVSVVIRRSLSMIASGYFAVMRGLEAIRTADLIPAQPADPPTAFAPSASADAVGGADAEAVGGADADEIMSMLREARADERQKAQDAQRRDKLARAEKMVDMVVHRGVRDRDGKPIAFDLLCEIVGIRQADARDIKRRIEAEIAAERAEQDALRRAVSLAAATADPSIEVPAYEPPDVAMHRAA